MESEPITAGELATQLFSKYGYHPWFEGINAASMEDCPIITIRVLSPYGFHGKGDPPAFANIPEEISGIHINLEFWGFYL